VHEEEDGHYFWRRHTVNRRVPGSGEDREKENKRRAPAQIRLSRISQAELNRYRTSGKHPRAGGGAGAVAEGGEIEDQKHKRAAPPIPSNQQLVLGQEFRVYLAAGRGGLGLDISSDFQRARYYDLFNKQFFRPTYIFLANPSPISNQSTSH